jgi:hypothetical protein
MENGRVASDRGMTTSQVAIVFPALLFFIMLIVQYGLWFHAKQVADTAAAEALDAAQTPAGSAADGHRAAESFLASSGNLDDVIIDVERDLEQVQVIISGAAPKLVPGFSWNVTASARAPVERFIPEPER